MVQLPGEGISEVCLMPLAETACWQQAAAVVAWYCAWVPQHSAAVLSVYQLRCLCRPHLADQPVSTQPSQPFITAQYSEPVIALQPCSPPSQHRLLARHSKLHATSLLLWCLCAALCMFPKGLHESLVHSVWPVLPESSRVARQHTSLLSSCSEGFQDVSLRCTNTFSHSSWRFTTCVSWKSKNTSGLYTGLLFLVMLPASVPPK